MPVSTTMTLVFELLGASLFLGLLRDTGSINAVKWASAGTVLMGIVCSIALSGVMGFFLQRAARGAIRAKWSSFTTLLLHGGWVGGGLMAGLCYFMMVKGGKDVGIIRQWAHTWSRHFRFQRLVLDPGALGVLRDSNSRLAGHLPQESAKRLFPLLTLLGMLSMAFAFGQNDLANCASPGLAAIALIHGHLQGMTVAE
jgi:phosphate/sulfate permease